jgi:hypothetical protein
MVLIDKFPASIICWILNLVSYQMLSSRTVVVLLAWRLLWSSELAQKMMQLYKL